VAAAFPSAWQGSELDFISSKFAASLSGSLRLVFRRRKTLPSFEKRWSSPSAPARMQQILTVLPGGEA
jgi:hypothetical protein